MTQTNLDHALEYLDRGWSVIPIKPEGKRPAIKWQEFQERLPTYEEVEDWWSRWPEHNIALVTGAISGMVVVDCDNEDALHAAFDAGMRSPVCVKTKRGKHLYFKHPQDGIRRGPRAGINSRGADWPRIPGLDFRGDGSYAVLPPSGGYTWEIAEHHDIDDAPVWQDWRPEATAPKPESEFAFEELDLNGFAPLSEFVSEWDRTGKFAREHFKSGKIPTGQGNGRNERVMRYASECILDGYFGDELRLRCRAFMSEFFEDPLAEPEFEATIRSMEQAERRNHPERFDEAGEYIYKTPAQKEEESKERQRRLIYMDDAADLLAQSEAQEYLIEPWLKRGTIVQVYGYSGHGKSQFVQHAAAALAAGQKYYGPFEVMRPGRVLYFDWENGMATVAGRLQDLKAVHGKTDDRLMLWAPWIEGDDLNLRTREGIQELQSWIEYAAPEVVVFDTIRSAWPGLEENDAKEWSPINTLAMRLRNAGYGVILLHHSNKPSGDGLGREAGNTNQLTPVETQIRVTQVYEDKDTAQANAAIFDGDYAVPVWPKLAEKLPINFSLFMVMEIRYGKVREWTDAHDRVQWIGLAQNSFTGQRVVVSSRSTKQKAKDLALDGYDASEIAEKLRRPVYSVKGWLGL